MISLRSMLLLGLCVFGAASEGWGVVQPKEMPLTPSQSLEKLMIGNKRYVENKLYHRNATEESRDAVYYSQHPFATILGCSDSRVSPEILFDQGIGDLFVVRVAGNVADTVVVDSVEYACEHLGSSLVMVLGHERCGAIKAVLDNNAADMVAIANMIEPAVAASKKTSGDPWENAAKQNVRLVVQRLKASPELSQLIKAGKLDVIGGYYQLQSGQVEIVR